MVVDVHDDSAFPRAHHDRGESWTSRYAHHGIYEAVSDRAFAPISPLGDGRIRREYRDGPLGFHRPAGKLHLQRSFLAQNAGADAARRECRLVLPDGYFRGSRASSGREDAPMSAKLIAAS